MTALRAALAAPAEQAERYRARGLWGGAAPALADVVAHLLSGGLARRKLPEQLVVWDGPLPRTASGKVIRSRLLMESPTKPSEQRRAS